MKAAWSDEPRLTFHGRFRQLDDVPIQPKPVQRPHPPIWFGANAPKALARAVRHGDGFLGAGSSTTESFIRQVGIIRRELDEQGRDAAGFAIGKRVYLAVEMTAIGLAPKFWMGCGDSRAECRASRMSPPSALLRTWCVAYVKSRTPVPK
jgi:alkanesulfonate monooxygenase SsuD/methylene tetrahydromethanopterin reductase-like flavin-dependent oxidoreductase (luciferase family)